MHAVSSQDKDASTLLVYRQGRATGSRNPMDDRAAPRINQPE